MEEPITTVSGRWWEKSRCSRKKRARSNVTRLNPTIRAVAVYQLIPAGAIGAQPVMAATCGSATKMTGADENYILTELKLKAYKYSADAIAEVDIQEVPGQEAHCEGNIAIGGTATNVCD